MQTPPTINLLWQAVKPLPRMLQASRDTTESSQCGSYREWSSVASQRRQQIVRCLCQQKCWAHQPSHGRTSSSVWVCYINCDNLRHIGHVVNTVFLLFHYFRKTESYKHILCYEEYILQLSNTHVKSNILRVHSIVFDCLSVNYLRTLLVCV